MKFSDVYKDRSYIEFSDRRAKAVFKDLREPREYRAKNDDKKYVVGYKVDGGIITSFDVQKCDYALCTDDDKIYFIELKGGNYKKALGQISDTVDNLIKSVGITAKEVNGRIVLSKCKAPALYESDEKKLFAKLLRLGGNLRKNTGVLEESI